MCQKPTGHEDEGSSATPCPHNQETKRGTDFRRADSKWVQRFFRKDCGCSFSVQARTPTNRLKNRRLNPRLEALLVEGVSQRSAARMLRV